MSISLATQWAPDEVSTCQGQTIPWHQKPPIPPLNQVLSLRVLEWHVLEGQVRWHVSHHWPHRNVTGSSSLKASPASLVSFISQLISHMLQLTLPPSVGDVCVTHLQETGSHVKKGFQDGQEKIRNQRELFFLIVEIFNAITSLILTFSTCWKSSRLSVNQVPRRAAFWRGSQHTSSVCPILFQPP